MNSSDLMSEILARADELRSEEGQLREAKKILTNHVPDLDPEELAIAKKFHLIPVLATITRRRD
ncbi:MAG: hypothetical protein JRN09_09260 [Nitrososphaerota archaeon]|nr:hypothetical protein [Nitrososphaerota archaeon]